MSKTKTNTEKIESIKLKIQQLENERKKILQAQKEVDRKARTKRLIEHGAILESLIPGADTFTNDQIKSLLEKTVTTENARKILDDFTAQKDETTTGESTWKVRNNGAAANGKSGETEQGAG